MTMYRLIKIALAAALPFLERRCRSRPLLSAGTKEFEAIRSLLARHVGPIAKIFGRANSGGSQTLDEFCDKLAANVRRPPIGEISAAEHTPSMGNIGFRVFLHRPQNI